eukprot:gene10035-7010_t
MVRYTQRPWYHPVGFMSSSPTSYAPLMFIIGITAAFPFRYALSEYFERQRDGPHMEIRQKAVKYYTEMERMHRRQALINLENMQDDNFGGRNSATLSTEALRCGHLDAEQSYWYAHQRDALRAEQLLAEVRELKMKLAKA